MKDNADDNGRKKSGKALNEGVMVIFMLETLLVEWRLEWKVSQKINLSPEEWVRATTGGFER